MKFRALAISTALALGALPVLGGSLIVGCISSDPPAVPTFDAAFDSALPAPTTDAEVPPPDASGLDASRDAEGGFTLSSSAAGGAISNSEHYKLITRTGGAPGTLTGGASQSFKVKGTLGAGLK